jgi:hypothetical protein
MHLRPLLSALCLLGWLATGHAQTPLAEPPPDTVPEAGASSSSAPLVQWSGFGTLGYTEVSHAQLHSFARDQTQDAPHGLGVDSRLGVQLNTQLSPQWSATAQLVAAQRSRQAPLSESLEWAFASYRPAPGWLLRAGRTSPDIFLHADVRSVGFAWPWVRPSQEFYAWMPMRSMDGVDLSRSWADDDGLWHLKAALGQASATTVDQVSHGAAKTAVRDMVTLTLRRETGPWTWKASYLHGQLDFSAISWLQQVQDGLAALAAVPLPGLAAEVLPLQQAVPVVGRIHYTALGLQYDDGPWLIHAEHSWQGGASHQSAGRHATLSIGRRWDAYTGYIIWGNSRVTQAPLQVPTDWLTRLSPYIGLPAAAQADGLAQAVDYAANSYRVAQRSVGLGLRWDLSPTWSLKTQWDVVHVDARGGALWHRPSNDATTPRVLSATLDFVF